MTTSASEYAALLAEIQNSNITTYTTVPTTEPRFSINANTRAIEVPSEFTFLGVRNDHKAETIYFEIDRYFDDVDLSEHTCVIQFLNKNASETKEGVYPVTTIDVDSVDGKIVFGWNICNDATQLSGDIVFSVRFYSIDKNGLFTYNFNTLSASSIILETLNTSDSSEIITSSELEIWNAKMESMASVIENDIKTVEEKIEELENSIASIPEDYTALTEEVSQLSSEIENKENGNIIGSLVKDSFVNYDGAIENYAGWSRTNYIDVSEIAVLKVTSPITIRYGCWFDEDKSTVVIPIKILKSGGELQTVPINAKYLMLSNDMESMENTTVEIVKTKREVLQNDLKYFANGKKRILIPYVSKKYIDTIGKEQKGDNWISTDYIECPQCIFCETTSAKEDATWNAFYDADKVFISTFDCSIGNVIVPENAKYMKLSCRQWDEQNVYECYTKKLKVCSWNVGLWTDGKSSNARVANENVATESIKLRRFLGNVDTDFLLCQEATHEFDKSYTIDAYDYCIKNNLPYAWKTSSNEVSGQVKQFLLTGKNKLKNVTYHNYECESTRGYVTFEAEIDGKVITFIVCHLSIEGDSIGIRQEEMSELANVLNNCEYGVLTGDFNAFSINEFDTHFSNFNMANHGYYGDFNTWPVEGWETWNHCLDNIITTKSIKITNVYMGEIDMSDHKPLIAELEVY